VLLLATFRCKRRTVSAVRRMRTERERCWIVLFGLDATVLWV
jgi:hypothetical protein